VPAEPAEIHGFTRGTRSIDGVHLHFRLGGDPGGPPVLLWHGFLATGYAWHAVAPALADAGCAVLVPDMRGYGDSDKPPGSDGYDGRGLAEEFRSLVREIGFGNGRPLTLVAHDMGAPPALIWAADHPDEIAGLVYMEVPVMLPPILSKIISYSPESPLGKGSMWWWVLPLAPGVPERLIVGHERAFLTWFYERYPHGMEAVAPALAEYLRTFSGEEGVLGALGVYRAAFETSAQTMPLTEEKVRVPVVALGGEQANGGRIREMVELVAEQVGGGVVADCGHFIPEERPEELVREVLKLIEEER
jgi:pimeloyl-ACP methyl ester carboxylesterase